MICRHCDARLYAMPGHTGRWALTDSLDDRRILGSGSECPRNDRGHEPASSEPSQTSAPVDASPEERAPEVSAQQGTPDLAASAPDRAVDAASTTPPDPAAAGGDQ